MNTQRVNNSEFLLNVKIVTKYGIHCVSFGEMYLLFQVVRCISSWNCRWIGKGSKTVLIYCNVLVYSTAATAVDSFAQRHGSSR